MELNIAIIGIGVIAFLNLFGYWKLHNKIDSDMDFMWKEMMSLCRNIESEHKKTRKDQQEIKTRLTQVRKDLNTIERVVRTHLLTNARAK